MPPIGRLWSPRPEGGGHCQGSWLMQPSSEDGARAPGPSRPRTLLFVAGPVAHLFKRTCAGVAIKVLWKRIRRGTMRLRVRSLSSLSGLRIWCCRELWCRAQMCLGAGVVAMATLALIRPLAWELPYAASTALKRQKTKQQTNKKHRKIFFRHIKPSPCGILVLF